MAEQPGTYALGSIGISTRRTVGAQPGQAGIQGGQHSGFQPLRPEQVDNSTTDLLMQMGRQYLEPKIQQRQTQAFLEGAQRVAQGEALKDIVDEQPWYTQIFGPSSSVQGARAIAQMKGVDDFVTSVETDMPELRKLSGTEFAAKVNERMKSFLTGDAVADSAIQMKMVEAIGPMSKAHTKQHYKWTQETMQKGIVSYMISGASKLQAQAKQLLDGTMTETDFNDVKAGFLGNLMPMAGQSPESYWGGIEAATVDALANGNHHAANVIFNSGLLDNAPAETRKKLIDERHKYEARTQETAGFNEYGPLIGQLQGMARAGQLTGNQIVAEVDKINKDYAVRFGVDRPLFKRDELVSLISGNISKIYDRAEADQRQARSDARADRREALKLDAKAKQDAQKATDLMQLIQAGAGNLAGMAGYSGDEINRAVYKGAQVIESKGGNVGKYLVQQYNEGGEHVNTLYQNQMQAGVRASKLEGHAGESFNRSYGLYKQLSAETGGKAAALAYLGDDGVRMMKYDSIVQQGKIAPEVAYQLAFGEPLDKSRKSSDKDIAKSIASAVSSDQPGMFAKLFGSEVPLTDQSQRVLVGAVAENYDLLVQNAAMDDQQATKVALELAKKDLDVVGRYVYPKGEDRKPLYQLIGADEKAAGKVFEGALIEAARANGVSAAFEGETKGQGYVRGVTDFITMGPVPALGRWFDRSFGAEPNVTITRLPDVDGQGVFGITVVEPDGKMTMFPMNSSDLRKRYESGKDFK